MRARQILTITFIAILLSSSVYAFDISTPGSSQVGFSSSSTSLNFDLNGILAWTYQLIADFFGVPMEDMQIRGGNLFSFVLVPILLAYMMFFGIIQKLNLFDEDWINKWIPLLLALMLAPLGLYRRFFFEVTSFMTTGTATLLYIFLFVALLGYGYRHMFARGVDDFSEGTRMIQNAKNKTKQINNVESKLKKLYRRETELDSQLFKLNEEMADLSPNTMPPTSLTNRIKNLEKDKAYVEKQITRLDSYQEKLTENLEDIIHK